MENNKAKNWGGARKGAGRKSEGRVNLTVYVLKETRDKLKEKAGDKKVSHYLDELAKLL